MNQSSCLCICDSRKWHRGRALKNMKARYVNPSKLLVTALDSHVICEDKDLLYEEAPQAYKDIEQVMQDMIDHGLITVIAILRPLITYKMRLRADAPSEGDQM
jgi:release factor H-coupled RctB family protein